MSFFADSKQDLSLILDIGNASICGSLVSFPRGGKPIILHTHREEIPFQQDIEADKLVFLMVRVLGRTLSFIDKALIFKKKEKNFGYGKVRHVYCVLASPWYMDETKTIRIERQTPIQITRRFLDDIVKKERDRFAKEFAGVDASPAHLKKNLSIIDIESKIIDIKLNGYLVEEPYGKAATTIEFSFYSSLASDEILRKVRSAIYSFFNPETIRFHSFSLAAFSAIRDMFPHESDFLSIDITGEITDISFVKQGVLLKTISFPAGRATLVRLLSRSLRVLPDVAVSTIRMLGENTLEAKKAGRIKKVLGQYASEWRMSFDTAVKELSRHGALPRKIFLTVDSDVSLFFVEQLEDKGGVVIPEMRGIYRQSFSVVYLDEKKTKPLVEYMVHVAVDPFISLEAIFTARSSSQHA